MPLEGPKAQLACSLVSGLLFAASWLFFIDGYVISRQQNNSYTFKHWTPGLIGTIAFVMINMVNPDMLKGSGSFLDEQDIVRAKAWFFFSVLIGFTALVLAIWMMIELMGESLFPDGRNATHGPNGTLIYAPAEEEKCEYCGVALLLEAFVMLISSFLFFAARGTRKSDYDIF
eukprot:TRINITY_DN3035_c0_g2_i1.p2 TRINITY_DN3035_c0_g2~~TRINITY_DN3035_c0_g2_i1.p2  ORF type:complete len:173 (+),score=62.17 TRINITY_DN3035_c0_g2_i1:69-587(+)